MTNENLSWLIKVLRKLNAKHKLTKDNLEIISRNLKLIRRDDELFNAVIRLKRIYGIIAETTGFINEIVGLPLMVIVIDLVIGNISGGYKVYLSLMGDVPTGRIGGKTFQLESIHSFKFQLIQLKVPIFTMFWSVGIVGKLVFACSGTYDTASEIFSQLNKFEFDQFERGTGVQSVVAELATQVTQQPIQFTIAGFYVITKTFLASVRKI